MFCQKFFPVRKSNDIVIDAGANFFFIYLSKKVGVDIYTFEPDGKNIHLEKKYFSQ